MSRGGSIFRSTALPCPDARASLRTAAWWGLLALAPLAFVAVEVGRWVRNIPNWDEFDTVLDFLAALDAGAGPVEVVERLVAVQNEHRTVVSRLLFAAAYWLWGGINFAALAVIGNLFLVGVFLRLLLAVPDVTARARLAVIGAFGIFQLQHHESFFWGGASIDHFCVILLAVLALGCLARERPSVAAGGAWGVLASFSLAQGLMIWPVGALVLGRSARCRDIVLWLAIAGATVAVFVAGFEFNPGHRRPELHELARIAGYALTLAGSSPALGHLAVAPWLGLALVAAAAWLAWTRRPGETLALATIAWCLGAIVMVAWGRALLANEWTPITPRYMILSSLPAALVAWLAVERCRTAHAAWRAGWWAVAAAAAGFNVAANAGHEHAGAVFARNAERAVQAFRLHGTFRAAPVALYPDPARADGLIRDVAEREIFELPAVHELVLCGTQPVELDDVREIGDAVYFLEDVDPGPERLRIRGWAYRPEHTTRLGDTAVLFRSARGVFAFMATPELRPDVAEAAQRWDAAYAGFDLILRPGDLPPGDYGIGVCFDADGDAEYMMTAGRVSIPGATLARH